MDTGFYVGWGTLALINAGLAQGKNRSGLNWFLLSLLLGPIATFCLVIADKKQLYLIRLSLWRKSDFLPSRSEKCKDQKSYSIRSALLLHPDSNSLSDVSKKEKPAKQHPAIGSISDRRLSQKPSGVDTFDELTVAFSPLQTDVLLTSCPSGQR